MRTEDPWRHREPYLVEYVVLLRRYWVVIVSAMLAALIIGAGVQLSSPARYKARTDVVVIATSDVTDPKLVSSNVSIDSAVQILLSDQVLGVTARALNYPGRSSGLLADMTISPLINSRILQLYVTSSTPRLAYDAVTLLVKNFLAVRQTALLADQKAAAEAIAAQLKSVQTALDKPAAPNPLPGTDSAKSSRELAAEQSKLQTELLSLHVGTPAAGYISHAATLPTSTVRSGGFIVMGSSAAMGLILGCAAAALLGRSRRMRPLPVPAVSLFRPDPRRSP